MKRMSVGGSLAVFTVLSVLLGVGTALSPAIARAGWAVGTLLALVAGMARGRGAAGSGPAVREGALVGAVSIAIGCGLALVLRALPASLLVAPTVVGAMAGASGGWLTARLRDTSVPPARQTT